MRARFIHMADCHLGYRQYNLKDRFNDFGRAFHHVIDVAIAEKVDFVLLAGDLFHKRAIDALTLNHAVSALERLKTARIPCIAVEGNHEHAYYEDFIGWMEFLNLRQYIILLDAQFSEGKPALQTYTRPKGSYYDPVPGLRVHGLRYLGAGTARAVEGYSAALAEHSRDGVEYSIFLTHAGIEGEVDGMSGLSMREWSFLREHSDYVALGHIHKPFTREDWIYNPGSLETCATLEVAWQERGYYLVEVDTERSEGPKHTAKLIANPRRPFERLFLKTDLIESPDALYQQARELMTRRARDLGPSRLETSSQPIVDFHLHGLLNFDRAALSLTQIEEMATEILNALHPLIRNDCHSADYAVAPGETMNRQTLERKVLADLFSRDARFAPRSRQWARLALDLKGLTLDGASPEVILDELEARMGRIDHEEMAEETAEETPEAILEAVRSGALEDGQAEGQDHQPENEVGDYANLIG
ncbi:MAG: exonuclease SbcCD subunit D [Caldilineaceae bacterium]|nr:exonuclease SbcCD subunit D [Caldilineaceae bacterium]